MTLFTPISIQNRQTLELELWHTVESYLRPLSLSNDIKSYMFVNKKTQPNTLYSIKPFHNIENPSESFFMTALKVSSYALILPVLIAIALSAYYRYSYKIQEDQAEESLLIKDKVMKNTPLYNYMHRISYKAFEESLPYCVIKTYDDDSVSSIFQKKTIQGRGLPKNISETFPPQEGRLAALCHINGNHYVGLFIDFKEKTLFYYDPFGNKNSAPVQLKRVYKTYFPNCNDQKIYRFDKNHHQKDMVNCGKYTLKFLETLISAEDCYLAFDQYTNEEIDSEKIYNYTLDIARNYPLWLFKKPEKKPTELDVIEEITDVIEIIS